MSRSPSRKTGPDPGGVPPTRSFERSEKAARSAERRRYPYPVLWACGPQSVVFDEAENRMWAQMAILVWLLAPWRIPALAKQGRELAGE